ncbi:hypothetical protein [Halobacteriovorax sp. DPLXC-1]|uniref:hypothetical protein n=1 Tax=Halobacteriovorax sp. DPLXC-1 TaxID=3110771 RepID=UPI002FF0ABE7
MKKMTAAALLTLIALQANAVEMRDASLGASSKVSEALYDAGKSSIDKTVEVADITGEQLEALISKSLQSSYRTSEQIAKQVIKISEVSKPVFRFTADGIAMVFEVSGDATKAGLQASRKIYIFLEPSLEKTGELLDHILDLAYQGTTEGSELLTNINEFLSRVLEKPIDITSMATEEVAKLLSKATRLSRIERIVELALEATTKGSELLTDLNEFLSKVLEKPIDISSMATEEALELIAKASEESSELTTFLVGADNLEKGTQYTGKGISLTSDGIGAAFYLVSQATTGISHLFDFNRKEREQIEQMVERGDVEGLAGLRDLIRNMINENVVNGEDLNALLGDREIDAYINLKLSVPNLDEELERINEGHIEFVK